VLTSMTISRQAERSLSWIVRRFALIGMSRYDNNDPEAREVEIGWTFLARRTGWCLQR